VRIDLCGVRGSMPAAGPAFAGVGGNTSCVAVAHDTSTVPTLVIDGGTGLRNVEALLGEAPFRGTLILSHLHWDHTQGLPFFTAADRPGSRVDVRLPVASGSPGHALDPFMAPPFFPITTAGLAGDWTFAALDEGRVEVERFEVLAREVPHQGGRTFGFRITDGHSSLAYVSDHGPIVLGPGPDGWGPYHEAVRELAEGVDVLLHDAQYTKSELAAKPNFGHSSVDYAVALAERCRAGRLVLFHHDPWRTDDDVEAIVHQFSGGPLKVDAAVEGHTIVL
jgi:phosphoribosyl 1,2-cyclic phosphodiesterase